MSKEYPARSVVQARRERQARGDRLVVAAWLVIVAPPVLLGLLAAMGYRGLQALLDRLDRLDRWVRRALQDWLETPDPPGQVVHRGPWDDRDQPDLRVVADFPDQPDHPALRAIPDPAARQALAAQWDRVARKVRKEE